MTVWPIGPHAAIVLVTLAFANTKTHPMTANNTRTWLSWSSGKDSYAALRALSDSPAHQVERLFTVLDGQRDQIPMHAVAADLLRQQALALGYELRPVVLDQDDPSRAYHELLSDARSNGVRWFGFGDLFLEDVRQRREANMQGSGIELVFPLWLRSTEPLIRSLLESGMRAVITSVDLAKLPAAFLGRDLTLELVDELVARGCDPCGEYGEFHSFVYDGPLFSHPVPFSRLPAVADERFAHLPLGAA